MKDSNLNPELKKKLSFINSIMLMIESCLILKESFDIGKTRKFEVRIVLALVANS